MKSNLAKTLAFSTALAVAVVFLIPRPFHARAQADNAAQQQRQAPTNAQPQRGQAGPGRAGGRGFGPPRLQFNWDNHTGFTRIFDGKDLKGWDGAPQVWRVEDGAIVGRSTAANPSGTTFIFYTASKPADFDLKLEMKLEGSSGNSGIQYRSRNAQPDPNFFAGRGRGNRGGGAGARGPAGPGAGQGQGGTRGGRRGGFSMQNMNKYVKWNMQGYQFDENTDGRGSGNLWEGGRFPGERGTVATIGQIVELETTGPNVLLGTVASPQEIMSWWKMNGWNQEEIVVRGNVLTHLINGHIITETIDDNTAKRVTHGGLIGIQVESGGDFTVSVRNIWLKVLRQ